jgi:S1-C subfamily serine protease
MHYGVKFRFDDGVPRMDGHVEVFRVFCGSPASHAGVRPGDLILTVNGYAASEPRVLVPSRPGMPFQLRIQRGESVLNVSFVSVARPVELMR